MSAAVPFIVAGIAGFGASKIVTKVTGSKMLGMIAGIAAGGFAGAAASPATVAGTVPGTAPSAVTPAGSTGAGALGGTGAVPTGTNFLPLPTTPQGITTGTGNSLLGTAGSTSSITPAMTAASVAPGTAAGASTPGGLSGLLKGVGLTPEKAWELGGSIATGYGDFKMKGRALDIYEDREQLARDKFDQENKERDEETAYGITRAGGGAPLNVQQQLDQVNKGSAMTGLNNLNTVQRPEGGYLAGYGRFMVDKEEEEVA